MIDDISKVEQQQVERAIANAIDAYISSRMRKVPEFVTKHFSVRGALKIHKQAIGSDLIKGPVNIFWSLPYMGIRAIAILARKVGVNRMASNLEKLPHGFETRVQKEVKWLIYTELLELPFCDGKRVAAKDALLEEMLNQPEIASLMVAQLSRIREKANNPVFRSVLEKNLIEYVHSRTAAADLAGNIITLAIGATVFKKMTPGAMVTGTTIATAIAQQAAISNFFLGPTLGSLYYSLFPVSASMGLIIASVGTIMAAMAIVTTFSGIATDPLQAKLGIHQRRLKKFINCLAKELKSTGDSRFVIKDQYVARIFDILDLLKMAATTAERYRS